MLVSKSSRTPWLLLAAVGLGIACSQPAEPLSGITAAGEGAAPIEAEVPATAPGSPWTELEPGLEIGEFLSPQLSDIGDSRIHVLRIDPQAFELRLMNASASDADELLTARQWCEREDLVAAINSSMYQTDYRTSVSLMRTRTYTNNPHLTKDQAVLAFDRLDASVPEVQIIDRECQDFEDLGDRYGTLVQSIRMISCTGKNVWTQQPKRWSTAAIGSDGEGRVLFVHVRSPYTTHDLINILMKLPLGLTGAMYTEGGPEAQLFIRGGGQELEFIGSFETGFMETDSIAMALPVPNVIGVARRSSSTGG